MTKILPVKMQFTRWTAARLKCSHVLSGGDQQFSAKNTQKLKKLSFDNNSNSEGKKEEISDKRHDNLLPLMLIFKMIQFESL